MWKAWEPRGQDFLEHSSSNLSNLDMVGQARGNKESFETLLVVIII
jgi:hypothetical protein